MFIDLKELKQKIGAQLKLKLKSSGVYVKKEYSTPQGMKTFNIFEFQVEQAGDIYTLGASDSLKRKLDDLDLNDEFMLSWEEFTTKDGQLRNYWKVEAVPMTKNEFDNYVAQKTTDKQVDPVIAHKVVEKSVLATNGARFGMIFNNTFKLYTDPNVGNLSWTVEQFANEFIRVHRMVEACENIEITNNDNENPPAIEKKVEEVQEVQKPVETQTYNADDLPF